jgi:hypothetical protein
VLQGSYSNKKLTYKSRDLIWKRDSLLLMSLNACFVNCGLKSETFWAKIDWLLIMPLNVCFVNY